jgi:DNA-binding response OmpR family regulator
MTTITTTRIARTARPAHSRIRPVDTESVATHDDRVEARGFALYVGLDEVGAAQAGVSLQQLVAALRRTAEELVPGIRTHATLAIAPRGAGGRDLDVTRVALHDPPVQRIASPRQARHGVVIDFGRQHVLVDGEEVSLTYKEFRLLGHLVEHAGETVHRHDLLAELWDPDQEGTPGERTIDVHVRRLRAKLGDFQDIIRTVRGIGYRFDRRTDVIVRTA